MMKRTTRSSSSIFLCAFILKFHLIQSHFSLFGDFPIPPAPKWIVKLANPDRWRAMRTDFQITASAHFSIARMFHILSFSFATGSSSIFIQIPIWIITTGFEIFPDETFHAWEVKKKAETGRKISFAADIVWRLNISIQSFCNFLAFYCGLKNFDCKNVEIDFESFNERNLLLVVELLIFKLKSKFKFICFTSKNKLFCLKSLIS